VVPACWNTVYTFPAMLEVALILALLRHFNAYFAFFCVNGDHLEAIRALSSHSFVLAGDLTAFLDRDGSTKQTTNLMVDCSSQLRHLDPKEANFHANFIWILNDGLLNLTSLPLRLDSNVLTVSCDDNVDCHIDEAYKVNSGPMLTKPFATWSEAEDLIVSNELWERRKDMGAPTFVSAVNELSPLLIFPGGEKPFCNADLNGSPSKELKGLFPDILFILEGQLNFTTLWCTSTSGKWGEKEKDGSWNGLVRRKHPSRS